MQKWLWATSRRKRQVCQERKAQHRVHLSRGHQVGSGAEVADSRSRPQNVQARYYSDRWEGPGHCCHSYSLLRLPWQTPNRLKVSCWVYSESSRQSSTAITNSKMNQTMRLIWCMFAGSVGLKVQTMVGEISPVPPYLSHSDTQHNWIREK